MKQKDPSHASPKELRGFGIGMTLFCLVLGGILFWRHHPTLSYSLWIVGGVVFFVPAMLFPTGLRPVFVVWTAVATRLSWLISRIILSLIFFIIFTFVSLIQKIIRRDPLHRVFPGKQDSYWIDRSKEKLDAKHYERLF